MLLTCSGLKRTMNTEFIAFGIAYYTLSAIIAEVHLKASDGNPVLWYVGGAVLAFLSALIGYAGLLPMLLMWVLHKRLT